MNKKRMLRVLWIIIALTIIFGCLFIFVKNKKKHDRRMLLKKNESSYVTSIKFNQTYTYDSTKDGSYAPSYIKFLDDKHYVAIPVLSLKEDPEAEEDEGPLIYFIQGEYVKTKDKIRLGKDAKKTSLNFLAYNDFKRGKYFKQKKKISSKDNLLPFSSSYLKKKGKYYEYRWQTRQGDNPDHINRGSVHLQKTKKDIPTTEKEFIRQYHKKQ